MFITYAADSQKNTQRSNRLFVNGEGHSKIIDENFYPGDEWKGDIARIIMYMYLRYPGQSEATNSAVEALLMLLKMICQIYF